ncbi:Endo/exonuclease/phosphatase domain-containing protein, partial [Aphis craccivora]
MIARKEVDFRNWRTEFIVRGLVRFTLARRSAVKISEFYIQSDLTIKDKVLKIFNVLFLTNVNLTRPQTTKSALRFRKSISQNENYFLWGCSNRHFSGFKLLYRKVYMPIPNLAS